MLNYEEELKKFKPSLEVDQIEEAVYKEDLTDMQNHVLPYLQSFCSLEEEGVKERREQQIAEKNESREAVPRTGVEANTVVKDAGKAERKAITEKKTMIGKEKKLSIHEHLKKYVQLWA